MYIKPFTLLQVDLEYIIVRQRVQGNPPVKSKTQVSELAYQVKTLATKADDLS